MLHNKLISITFEVKFVAVVNFNHYFGCQKCMSRGIYFNQYRVMSFPRTNGAKRTNQTFRHREQVEHHKNPRSVIEDLLNVDMVADFPTSDPLHLLELGVMRRCLLRWKEGTKSYRNYFRRQDLNQINLLIKRANEEMPSEIHRSLRSLDDLHFWKGTEYRTFLLYVGIVVLKDMLTSAEYHNFKLLSCATILLTSNAYNRIVHNTILVDSLIGDYIESYIDIYGEHSISSNIHNLCHLLDDVRHFGNLNTISTYPFENYLGIIKSKLRAMKNPLQQIGRRMYEIDAIMEYDTNFNFDSKPSKTELKFPFRGNKKKFKAIFLNDFRLSSRKLGKNNGQKQSDYRI